MFLEDRRAQSHGPEARVVPDRMVAETDHGIRESAREAAGIAPSRTLSYGVGYIEVHCSKANGTPARRRIMTAGSMDARSFIPVLRITGLPNDAIRLMSG